MALDIERAKADNAHLLKIKGEVDLYTSPTLRKALLKTIPGAGDAAVAVDLSEVGYMDSSGVATLVEGFKAARESNTRFVLVTPSAPVMKVLTLARLDSLFTIEGRAT